MRHLRCVALQQKHLLLGDLAPALRRRATLALLDQLLFQLLDSGGQTLVLLGLSRQPRREKRVLLTLLVQKPFKFC